MKNFILTILFFGAAIFLPYSAYALTISPVKFEITGDPGQTLNGELTLYNEEEEAKTLYSSAENFESRDESGAPFFVPDRKGLAIWIKTEPQINLEPKETKTIPYTIEIPQDAEPGGYFAAILWSATPPGSQTDDQVSIGGRLGMLVILTVSGEVKESGELLEFGTGEQRMFFDSLPITFSYRFSNTGSNTVTPKGEITINDLLFGSMRPTMDANPGANKVLPNSTRKFEIVWGAADEAGPERNQFQQFIYTAKKQWNNFIFGRYEASLNLTYGLKNTPVNASMIFFIFPWQLLSIITVMVIVGLLFLRMMIKKYNQLIVRSAIAQIKKQPRKRKGK